MAGRGVEYPARVRPRSSEKNAWLLSAPSTVLLLSRVLIPRKLTRPKPFESFTTPGVSTENADHRPPLMGRLLICTRSTTGANSGEVVLIVGASPVTLTVSAAPAMPSLGDTSVRLPI